MLAGREYLLLIRDDKIVPDHKSDHGDETSEEDGETHPEHMHLQNRRAAFESLIMLEEFYGRETQPSKVKDEQVDPDEADDLLGSLGKVSDDKIEADVIVISGSHGDPEPNDEAKECLADLDGPWQGVPREHPAQDLEQDVDEDDHQDDRGNSHIDPIEDPESDVGLCVFTHGTIRFS
jgi:hypothetical protein